MARESPGGDLAPPPTVEGAKSGRYAYLVGRLHNRQITMEEATELFGILQAMLRESQAARARIERGASRPSPPSPPSAPAPAAPPRAALSDDLLLLGLLAVGAGAGLGAALARRATAGPGGSPDERTSRTGRSARAP